mmetsp:Transcript_19497/g.32554  ORF Transcript_19497/g.32554 Transcript_19497/m.32554 type:complete len:107 (-) Transcript_19497:66-386(-)
MYEVSKTTMAPSTMSRAHVAKKLVASKNSQIISQFSLSCPLFQLYRKLVSSSRGIPVITLKLNTTKKNFAASALDAHPNTFANFQTRLRTTYLSNTPLPTLFWCLP